MRLLNTSINIFLANKGWGREEKLVRKPKPSRRMLLKDSLKTTMRKQVWMVLTRMYCIPMRCLGKSEFSITRVVSRC